MCSRVSRKYLAILSTVLFCVSAMPARAATITVTNPNDNGPGSLRQALADANDGDLINFAVTGNIVLTSGGLAINKNITTSDPGADHLSIDCNQSIAVFRVFSGKPATVSGLTVRNGQAGIWNEGMLTVSNCTVSDNSDVGLSNNGILTANNCVISHNSGNGLFNGYAILSVSDCVVTANSYSGIYNYYTHGPSSSVQRGNDRREAKKIDGPSPGDLTVANTIISDNSEHGVYNDGGQVMILNSTLSDNSAGQEYAGGGGISSRSPFKNSEGITMINSAISGNSASIAGGGIFADYTGLIIVKARVTRLAVSNR